MSDPFRHLHMTPESVCRFLAVFSRMEYALKATGTYALGAGGQVAAAWDKFANDHNDAFCAISDDDFTASVDYLLKFPPRKQILCNGVVTFVDQEINTKQCIAQQTLIVVRAVRNNLFHGAKYLPGCEEDPGRNQVLVCHALIVLERCLAINDDVRHYFEC